MSTKWYRFKILPGLAPDSLQTLIHQQSEKYRQSFNWPLPGDTITDAERQASAREYVAASEALLKRFSFRTPTNEVQHHDAGIVLYNFLIPLEWREAAKRTFLPGELPQQLEQWQSYTRDVRLGYYEDYLHQIFLYEDYNPHGMGYEGWHQLLMTFNQRVAQSSMSREDWAQVQGFRRTLEEIMESPVLPFSVERPVLQADSREKDLTPATKDLFAVYKQETERLMHQILAWNRCVPEAQKLRIPTFIPVQVRLHQRQSAAREYLQKFLVWVQETVDAEMGLFLAT